MSVERLKELPRGSSLGGSKLAAAASSYCWLTPAHPDPLGEQLVSLAEAIEKAETEGDTRDYRRFPSEAAMNAHAKASAGALILDEIYQGLHHHPVGYSTGLAVAEDLYILNSFSKYFGMTGWRLGWVVAPDEAVEPLTKLAQNLFISPSAPAQYAALATFDEQAMVIHEVRREIFARRAALLADGLRALGFQIPVVPDGAFYLYVDISHTGMTSNDFCWRLMNEFQVAVTPGSDFGSHQADRYARFAYTRGAEAIELGLTRIASALESWGIDR